MTMNKIYKDIFCFSPNKHQDEIWNYFADTNNLKKPLILKAPTGSGKTEAILAPFLNQFLENNFYIAPRLIYVLPMRVLVNTISDRIRKYAEKISPYISVKIQHGDLPDAPFFLSDIVITTLDQFVYGLTRSSQQVGKHIDIPVGSIASSLIVFDEAHMYRDEFTFSVMRAIMEILYESKIPFVVMTATMPESLEKSLFENIKDYTKIMGEDVINSKLRIRIWDKPLYANNEVNIDMELLENVKKRKTLIVLNQVKRAQKVYEEIKKRLDLSNNQIVLLHSRFTKKDREINEKSALSLIPHKENGKIKIPEGVSIVVSTQVLEAGIDFSAELLLTEIAPADCLVQRAGRCARYEGEEGEMIIFPVDDEKGYKPYEKEHIMKTINWIRNNTNFNIKNFKEVCSFVDELDYQANDFEARDTLVDLYECVLYADTKPQNIQVRNSKPVTLVVIDSSIGEGKKKEDIIRSSIRKTAMNLRENSIDIDIGVAWQLFNKDGILKYRFKYDVESKNWDFEEIREIQPFNMYIIEKNDYDENIGVKNDASYFI
uniref:CRISPR-associated helicase Cas3 n=1 Tax=candidate division WOR-3 bacterium TaxID=2052148 RepID=A0A7C3J6U5_UNCW3